MLLAAGFHCTIEILPRANSPGRTFPEYRGAATLSSLLMVGGVHGAPMESAQLGAFS
jgi:hypothetical protein